MIAAQVVERGGHVVQGIPRGGREEPPVHNNGDSLVGVGGDVRNAFGGSSNINLGEGASFFINSQKKSETSVVFFSGN